MAPESQGWSQRALDQLSKRVDALEIALARLIGVRPTDEQLMEPKTFRLGPKDWIGIGATIVVPLAVTILGIKYGVK
jgi:hypothetical protein